ncbi:MAG: PD40 domain-containing protein, partial [Acidobacteria bacterium]|nr:PD40 domain-containing protein [Acidobacteriota bacterium]
ARELVGNVWPGGVAVSPDGRWIVYGAEQDGTVGIWRATFDGLDARLLTAVADPGTLTMAPSGQQVYFTSLRGGSAATYRVSIDGGDPVLVAAGLERAAPSPDGRLLAGIYKASPESPVTLGIIDVETGKAINTISDYAAASGSGGTAWLPDGKTLLFTTAERTNLWKQPAMGGARERVTNFGDLWIVRFALAPDGKSVLFCRGIALRDAVLLTKFR